MASTAKAEWRRRGRSRITNCRPWKQSARSVRRVWRHTVWPTWLDHVFRRRFAAALGAPAFGVLRAAVGADSYRADMVGEPAHGRRARVARSGSRGGVGKPARPP